MPTKKIELDRKFLKTQKSRSTEFTLNKKSGFTLIELLVVISIIALLSTVVLSTVNDARVKARNTAKNSLVLEYIKALDMYRSDKNSYPSTTNVEICFGYSTLETCFADGTNGLDSVKTSMQPYLPGDFAQRETLTSGIGDLKGTTYKCEGSNCNSYRLEWILEKNKNHCTGDNSTETPNFFGTGHTYCSYISK